MLQACGECQACERLQLTAVTSCVKICSFLPGLSSPCLSFTDSVCHRLSLSHTRMHSLYSISLAFSVSHTICLLLDTCTQMPLKYLMKLYLHAHPHALFLQALTHIEPLRFHHLAFCMVKSCYNIYTSKACLH